MTRRSTRKSNGAGLARGHTEPKHKMISNPAVQRTAALAGTATIAAGALAAGLLAMKGPLGLLARNTAVEVGRMAEHLGLQKKRPPLSIVLPAAGLALVAVAIGSLGAIWFAKGGLDRRSAVAAREGIDRVNSKIETFDTSVADEAR